MLKFKMFNWHQLNMVSYHGISANDLWISLVVQSFHHQNQPDFPGFPSCIQLPGGLGSGTSNGSVGIWWNRPPHHGAMENMGFGWG
jgi:hypothetical protein